MNLNLSERVRERVNLLGFIICAYVCVFVRLHVCACVYMGLPASACVQVYMHGRDCMRMCVYR